jgi:hypothetical protein
MKWTKFFAANIDNPFAKCLHVCQSQGALHTKNALLRLPKEIRERIIVVAIAPAAVVPKELCFESYNYVSKRDFVHWGENAVTYTTAFSDPEDPSSYLERLETLYENKEEIIWLDPHENADLFDHSFQSPTFEGVIKKHLQEYDSCHGEYR